MSDLGAIIEYLGLALVSPREYMRILMAERRGLLFGFVIVLLSSIVFSMVASYVFISRIMHGLGIPAVGIWVKFASLFMAGGLITSWIILGALAYAISRGLGGSASLEDVLNALSLLWLTAFIHGLISPLYTILDYVSGILLFMAVSFIALLWGLILVIIANAEANKFSIAKSLVSLIIVVIIIIFFAFIASMASIII